MTRAGADYRYRRVETSVRRRALSKGLSLDRRTFLHSYDPYYDPEGKILEGVLTAVGPVIAGIGLEYYFSRVDNGRYGSGTKILHNVSGLVGGDGRN